MTTNRRTLDHYTGCLLGGAVGDALGGAVEFMSLTSILNRFGPDGILDYAPAYGRVGAITDDTQMTLFSAEGLILHEVKYQDMPIPVTVVPGAMSLERVDAVC